MTKLKGIFAVSFIAMMSVGVASANIASQGYVDQEVGTRLSAISGSTSGAGNVVTSVTASGGTVTATKGITAEVTSNKTTSIAAAGSASDTKYPSEKAVATALSAKANTADIPTKVSQLSNDSGFITADELPDDYSLPAATVDSLGGVKSGGDITVAEDGSVTVAHATKADTATSATSASTATTASSATKATQDGNGKVIADTYATKTELSAVSATASAAQTAAEEAASAAETAQSTATAAQSTANSKLATSTYNSQIGTVNATNMGTTATTVVTAIKEVAGEAAAAQSAADDAAEAAATAQNTASAAQTAAASKVATAQGSGNANKAVITNASGNITTGTITSAMITDGTITNADIAANAAIAQSKISGLTTALAGKANTADVPTKTSDLTNDSGFITSGDLPAEYELPVATADALGGVKSGGDITVATSGAVTVNSATQADSATKATQDASGNVITTTYATKAQLNALDSSTSGSGAVVTNVSQTDGKVTVTKGNVQIPVGSATATTYATIWVE